MDINVMVCDDEAFICEETASAIRQMEDVRVITTNSAPEDIKLIRSIPLGVIFLDIQMPGMTGIEILQYIQEEFRSCYCRRFKRPREI
jgi:DNA-binding NarL/FixJ family response regulator